MGRFFAGIFFPTFLEIKVDFPSERTSIRQHIIITCVTHQFQHGHELIHGLTIHDTLITITGVQEELTLHGINDTAGQVLVLHGICLIT